MGSNGESTGRTFMAMQIAVNDRPWQPHRSGVIIIKQPNNSHSIIVALDPDNNNHLWPLERDEAVQRLVNDYSNQGTRTSEQKTVSRPPFLSVTTNHSTKMLSCPVNEAGTS